jgi:hypothetical protein
MTSERNEQILVKDQQKTRRKPWVTVVIIISAFTVLCILGFCIVGAIGLINGTRPKTNPLFYTDASIAHIVENCTEDRYYSWEDWMLPVSGSDIVLLLNYSKAGPAPEAIIGYTFFVQIDPRLIETGQQTVIPGPGIQPFLLETRAPYMVCSPNLTGTIKFLETSEDSIRTALAVSGPIYKSTWEYEGQVDFKKASLP